MSRKNYEITITIVVFFIVFLFTCSAAWAQSPLNGQVDSFPLANVKVQQNGTEDYGINDAFTGQILAGIGEGSGSMGSHEQFLLIATVGILLTMGLYHFGLYGFRRKDPSSLYFALFCLLWALSTMTQQSNLWLTQSLFGTLSLPLMWRLELFGYFMSIPMLCFFFHSFFPKEVPRYLPIGFLILAILFSLWSFFSPDNGRSLISTIFHGFSLIVACWVMVALLRALHSKRQGAAIIFTGALLLTPFAINDIFYDMRIVDTGYFMSVGLLLFILCQALSLAHRFSLAFATSEVLSSELQEKNIALSQLDKMKDDFLANTSHELRTPLSGIIGLAESMLAGATGELSGSAQKNLSMVAASGKRLSSLVDDLLDFSLLKNKELNLDLHPVDIHSLVDAVLTVLSPLAQTKEISLVNDLPDKEVYVLGDENRLQQILYNLVGNGIKFTDVGRVVVSASVSGSRVEVLVSDTGIGIPKEKQGAIFLSFEQVDASAARKYGGTGLGLAITKHLVELHGGTIRVESVIDEGTRFFFDLPVSKERVERSDKLITGIKENHQSLGGENPHHYFEEETTGHADEHRQEAILVVDDDPINLQVAANHIRVAGYQVQTATSGIEALQIINSSEKPDLVLLDIMMPSMSGYEVCREIRKDHTISELPIIMLTAKNRTSDLVAGYECGTNDYLTKPFSREELLSRLHSQLQQKEAYLMLEENLLLKQQLKEQEKALFDLQRTHQRLNRMLDTVDDTVMAVNETGKICFANQNCQQLMNFTLQDLIGQEASVFFDPPKRWTDALLNNERTESSGSPFHENQCKIIGKDNVTIDVQVLATLLRLEEEVLTVLVLKTGKNTTTTGNDSVPVLRIIGELNRNRERIKSLEENLNELPPTVLETNPVFVQEVQKIDTALAQLSTNLLTNASQGDRRLLVVQLMNSIVDYWKEATGQDQIELARLSGLWKIDTNPDGWERTKTLDRYLTFETAPIRPRLKPVISTADYVLTTCKEHSPLRGQLEITLAKLQTMW